VLFIILNTYNIKFSLTILRKGGFETRFNITGWINTKVIWRLTNETKMTIRITFLVLVLTLFISSI
ncbi:hypothetical protein V7056_19715, partial [Bacillus sp. JJ664]